MFLNLEREKGLSQLELSVVNRGIERSNVYRSDRDKEKFLEISCKEEFGFLKKQKGYLLQPDHFVVQN